MDFLTSGSFPLTAIHPTFIPGSANIFENPLSVKTSGASVAAMRGNESNPDRNSLKTSSEMIGSSWRAAISASPRSCCSSATMPVGLCGEIRMMALVPSVI